MLKFFWPFQNRPLAELALPWRMKNLHTEIHVCDVMNKYMYVMNKYMYVMNKYMYVMNKYMYVMNKYMYVMNKYM